MGGENCIAMSAARTFSEDFMTEHNMRLVTHARVEHMAGAKMVREPISHRSPQVETELQRRLFTVEEYYRLADAGILGEDDRVELIDGEIVEMSPIGTRHSACVDRLNVLLQEAFKGRGIVRVQSPIRLHRYSEPQPDLSILKPRTDFYDQSHPTPSDILLVVEVADASLQYDRNIKVELYARAAIGEVWLVDLVSESVEVFTSPGPQGYLMSVRVQRGERVKSGVLPEHQILTDDIVGGRQV